MELQTRDSRCVTILLRPGAALSGGGARLLVRYAQRHCGAAPWGRIAVDQFRCGGQTLMIARPVSAQTARLADYAFPFLYKYFMD